MTLHVVDTDTGELVSRSLADCEAVIERGLNTFVEVGAALMEIRDSRLYRSTHGDFDTYCQDRWGFSRRRAGQMIEAAEVGTMVPTSNERQARALAPLKDDPEVMAEVMAEVAEEADKVTARAIGDKVAEKVAERLAQAEDARAEAESFAAEVKEMQPPDFDPVLNRELIRQRGELARLCRDLIAIGDQESFIERHGDFLRAEHHQLVRDAVAWLLELELFIDEEKDDDQ